MTFSYLEKCRVRFADGRKGVQHSEVYDDGSRELQEVVVTKEPDGTRCEHVYCRVPDLRARVYSLADLGNVQWDAVPGTTQRWCPTSGKWRQPADAAR